VAFAIGRPYGNAVLRNRLRRRLRVIVRDLDAGGLLARGYWLFGARPPVAELTFDELRRYTTMLARSVSDSLSSTGATFNAGESTSCTR
jgi:ribonuclease P protein component